MPPDPENKNDQTLSEPQGNLFSRLSPKNIPTSVLRYGGVGLVILLALVVVFVMRNFASGVQQIRQEELRATAQALALPTIESVTGGLAGAMMPSFENAGSQFSQGIPRLASIDTTIPSRSRTDMTTYTVLQGDNLFAIADKFGLKPESVLFFNLEQLDDNPSKLEIGMILNIPPVDGVPHTFHGESLTDIAEMYKTNVDAILDWPGNNLDPYEIDLENPNIPDGAVLVVVGGQREPRDWGPPAVTRQNAATAAYYGSGSCGSIYEGAVGDGTFVWPTVATYLSGTDYTPPLHNGIDIAGAEGNAVYAIDSGVVVYAGWSEYGFGNLVVIDHGTGFQSAYAHLSSFVVGCGQSVTQGVAIGGVGNTGNSSGPHLHFEINLQGFGKVNPWNYVSP